MGHNQSPASGRPTPGVWSAAGLAVVMTMLMNWIGQPLRTAAAPQGMVSFEFAGTSARAAAMIRTWDESARLVAAFSLGLDFLYPPVYAAAIYLACARVAGTGFWPAVGRRLAAAAWLAAGLDYVENVALAQTLLGAPTVVWTALAWGCAAVKFALIGLALFYAAAGGGRQLWRARRRET